MASSWRLRPRLVDGGADAAHREQLAQLPDAEVAHPDAPDQALRTWADASATKGCAHQMPSLLGHMLQVTVHMFQQSGCEGLCLSNA
jgi:hypothetical protein